MSPKKEKKKREKQDQQKQRGRETRKCATTEIMICVLVSADQTGF
jgi:hypothetical protein